MTIKETNKINKEITQIEKRIRVWDLFLNSGTEIISKNDYDYVISDLDKLKEKVSDHIREEREKTINDLLKDF